MTTKREDVAATKREDLAAAATAKKSPAMVKVRVVHAFISNRGLGTPEAPFRGNKGIELTMTQEQYDAMVQSDANKLGDVPAVCLEKIA